MTFKKLVQIRIIFFSRVDEKVALLRRRGFGRFNFSLRMHLCSTTETRIFAKYFFVSPMVR